MRRIKAGGRVFEAITWGQAVDKVIRAYGLEATWDVRQGVVEALKTNHGGYIEAVAITREDYR
jgi:hypothetical protein